MLVTIFGFFISDEIILIIVSILLGIIISKLFLPFKIIPQIVSYIKNRNKRKLFYKIYNDLKFNPEKVEASIYTRPYFRTFEIYKNHLGAKRIDLQDRAFKDWQVEADKTIVNILHRYLKQLHIFIKEEHRSGHIHMEYQFFRTAGLIHWMPELIP